jgi:hypothetical protein
MSNEHTIEMIHPVPIRSWLGREFKYFRIDVEPGRWQWRRRLAAACWWILGKLGARLEEETAGWKTVSFSTDKILEKIRLSRNDLARVWHRKADTILISPDLLDDALMDITSSPFVFDVQLPIGMGDDYKILGMRVVVCPWIKGWALLPEEVSKR